MCMCGTVERVHRRVPVRADVHQSLQDKGDFGRSCGFGMWLFEMTGVREPSARV